MERAVSLGPGNEVQFQKFCGTIRWIPQGFWLFHPKGFMPLYFDATMGWRSFVSTFSTVTLGF
jgi:hypothetical protein